MGAHDNIFYTGNALPQVTEERSILLRQCIADGIRDVNGCCAALDCRLKDAAEKIPFAARGICRGKLDGWTQISRIGNHGLDALECFLTTVH